MSGRLHAAAALVIALAISACATTRPIDLSASIDRPGDRYATLQSKGRLSAPERAERARLAQAMGHSAAAANDWLEALADPSLRPWAALNLAELAEHTPIDARWLTAARAHPELAELAEQLALALHDTAALDAARSQLGTRFSWRRSGRLLRYPGRTTSAAVNAGLGDPQQSIAGYLASPEQGPGLYAFELAIAPGTHRVEVLTEAAVRAFVGGVLVHDNNALETLAPERTTFDVTVASGQALQIHLVARSAVARARVFIRAPFTTPPPKPGFAATYGALELALADRDLPTAYDLLDLLPSSALQRHAAARIAITDPSRAPERARAAAKALLVMAVTNEPTFVEARALLAELHAADLELEDARRVLGDLDAAPAALDGAIITSLQPNDPAGAARRAEAFIARAPRSCTAREHWLDNAWDRLRLHVDALVTSFAGTAAPLPGKCLEAHLRAVDIARGAFDLAGADRLLEALFDPAHGLDPGPDRARALLLRAQNALARGDWSLAASAARAALVDGGADAYAHELLGRAERLAGGPPRRRIAATQDIGLPLRDARELILERCPTAARCKQGDVGREVLLDDRHVRVNADGSLRIRVHRIVRVNDVAAVEAVGELPVPDDAEVLFVRTWKLTPKGVRSIEPEDILEKTTVSLPNLAPGDVAEWAYFYPLAASPRLAPGWRAPTHSFDDARATVALARFTLSLAPGARPPTFAVDPRLRPPARPDAATWVFEATALPRVFSEPGDPRPEARLMTLVASSGLERAPLTDALAAEIALGTRVTPTLDAMMRVALDGLPDDAAPTQKVQALFDYVRRHVDEPEEATPFSVEASWVAERRRGSRPLLLTALCRAANLACELVLARPLWEGPEPALPSLDARDGLSYALVRWAPLGEPPRWLDPIGRWMPFGTLPPALEGVFALSLGASQRTAGFTKEPSVLETPPADPSAWGERKAAMTLAFSADGQGITAEGDEVLDGVFAASWRTALVAMPAEARQRALSLIVQQALPNATVESVTLTHLEDDTQPLSWRWRATTQTVASDRLDERGARTLQMALFPEGLTHDTVLLPQRTTPLLVNRAARMTLSLTFTCTPDWVFVRGPSDQAFDYDLGRFERATRFEALGRKAVVDKRFVLRPGIIEPARYPAWSDAAVAIDRFDVIQIVAARTRPPQRPE